MSHHGRRRSRSASVEPVIRSRRETYDDGSLAPRNDGSHKDGDRRQYRNRSYSPAREHRDRESHNRRKRRSMSPPSDLDDKSRKRERRSHRSRSPREPRDKHKHKRRRSRSLSRSRSPFSRSHPNPPTTTITALPRSRGPLPPQKQAFTKDLQTLDADTPPAAAAVEKQKPNFNLTGKLAAASNTVQTAGQTIVLKYHEPAEARKPAARDAWRMYVFKDEQIVDTVQLWEQSCWLFGRELAVADVPVEHPSCSGQHAVVQFRYVERRNEFGDKLGRVRPYVLDLESAQGTWLNEERVEEGRYFELRDGDVLKFGRSRREYVVQLPTGG